MTDQEKYEAAFAIFHDIAISKNWLNIQKEGNQDKSVYFSCLFPILRAYGRAQVYLIMRATTREVVNFGRGHEGNFCSK